MFVLSPMHEMAIQSSDAAPKALANKQKPYDNRSPDLVCSNSLSSPQQLSPTLASVSVPGSLQCPYPNPPPSPGPRRPGPVHPRPNVPTPPPSPRRSMGTNDPWIFFFTASTFAILVLEYLSSTTWHGQGGAAHEGDVSTAARDGMTYAPNGTTRYNDSRLVHEVAQTVTPWDKLLERQLPGPRQEYRDFLLLVGDPDDDDDDDGDNLISQPRQGPTSHPPSPESPIKCSTLMLTIDIIHN
ncbi:hypothetical protein CIB48_g11188 [Xylaria polymorpha]|nr:hypothetical protein CIB48_g11188 [Xylaria polymorpha]